MTEIITPTVYTETISRFRGDTHAEVFQVVDESNAPINITGDTFVMSWGTEGADPGTSDLHATITGNILDALNGLVEFVPTDSDANPPEQLMYYDVQRTASGRLRTIAKGELHFSEPVTP